MNPLKKISLSPNHKYSIKTRFTYNFLRALKQVNNKNTNSSSRDINRRFHQVKYAANISMAAAVGSKRAWSRAILWKIRRRRRIYRVNSNYMKMGKAGYKKEVEFDGEISETKELMKIVPGVEGMETGSLLDETAHYIKCLTIQVQVMKHILHLYSS